MVEKNEAYAIAELASKMFQKMVTHQDLETKSLPGGEAATYLSFSPIRDIIVAEDTNAASTRVICDRYLRYGNNSANSHLLEPAAQQRLEEISGMMKKRIEDSGIKGVALGQIEITDIHDYSTGYISGAGFPITFTNEADKDQVKSFITGVAQDLARASNYPSMLSMEDRAYGIGRDWNANPRDIEKENLLQAIEKVFPKEKRGEELESAVGKLYAALDEALEIARVNGERPFTHQEQHFVDVLRSRRSDLGFNSMMEMAKHSLADGKGCAGRAL